MVLDRALTFADHLGTPFLQTSTNGTPTWRADLEPYGDVWSMRTGDAADQRLRFPGQEYDEQAPERAYNIFRWYRAGWGRYTQADPISYMGLTPPYTYAEMDPIANSDPDGLAVFDRACAERIAGELLKQWDGQDPYEDAMKHCIWSCRMARECEGKTAWIAATAYELGPGGWMRDGPFNNKSAKDFENNRVGRQCANLVGKCETICASKAANKTLNTAEPKPDEPWDPDPSCPSCNWSVQ